MKTSKIFATKAMTIAACAALSMFALAGCSGGDAGAETQEPQAEEAVEVQGDGATDELADLADDAVVEVLDESGNTVQMTAAEAKAAGKQIVSGGNAASGSSPAASTPSAQAASTPAAPAAAPAPSAPAAPVHEHSWQYIVDTPAWDETTYKTVETAICNGCGADITSNPWGHCAQDRTSPCQGFRSGTKQVPAGTVHHDAVGHYACACGATK